MGGGGDGEVKETEQEKALAQVAAEQHREYREKGVPLENELIERSDPTAADYAKVEGRTNADVQAGIEQKQRQRTAEFQQLGVNPTSGMAVMQGTKAPEAAASAAVKANQAVSDRGLAQKQQLIAIGRGQATDALNSMAEQASTAASSAIKDKELEVQKSTATGAGVGTALGMGIAEYRESQKDRAAKGGI